MPRQSQVLGSLLNVINETQRGSLTARAHTEAKLRLEPRPPGGSRVLATVLVAAAETWGGDALSSRLLSSALLWGVGRGSVSPEHLGRGSFEVLFIFKDNTFSE